MHCMEKHTNLDYICPAGTFYMLINIADRISKKGPSFEIAKGLIKREKVVTIPGVAFGQGGEGFLRISFAADPPLIEEGIKRIGRFFS